MLGRLFLLFTIVPFIELFLLMKVGEHVGFWPTVASIVFTGFLGAWLAKREGLRVLRETQQALAEMRMPEEGLLSALLVLVGGVLLIAPGVLTDLVGIALMIPPLRKLVAKGLARAFEGRVTVVGSSGVRVHVRQPAAGPSPSRPGRGDALEPDLILDERGRVIARLE